MEDKRATTLDFGWKKFAVSVVDLLRWPVAFLVVALLLREPISRLIDALAAAIKC